MDYHRRRIMAYEYLCRLEEVKNWLETCFNTRLPSTQELEDNLRNGVYLARLANFINPTLLPLKKIYDIDQQKYYNTGLQYRHINNIIYFINCIEFMKLPKNYQPETTDIYDKKNMPRLINCIHMISHELYKINRAKKINNIYGQIEFNDSYLDVVGRDMTDNGFEMPQFKDINELSMPKTGDIISRGISVPKNSAFKQSTSIVSSKILPIQYDENKIIKLQAYIRGYLARKKFDQLLMQLISEATVDKSNESIHEVSMVEQIDEWVNGKLEEINNVRCGNYDYIEKNNVKVESVSEKYDSDGQSSSSNTIKSLLCTCNYDDYNPDVTTDSFLTYAVKNARLRSNDKYEIYEKNLDKIVKIQALWRGYLTRKFFKSTDKFTKSTFKKLKQFPDIYQITIDRYKKDLHLQVLKENVLKTMKYNQKLLQKLDIMDIKIKLLVKNKVCLKEDLGQSKKLNTSGRLKRSLSFLKTASTSTLTTTKGLISFTKEGVKMQEGYQHLFYELQTKPDYLAKLLFQLPTCQTDKLVETLTQSLFNFGSTTRDEYYLLKFLSSALREEIHVKYSKPLDLITNNSIILKMVINYTKELNGKRALKNILEPIMGRFLCRTSFTMDTNPVTVYNSWLKQIEEETGKPRDDLPTSVTRQQAMAYAIVEERVTRGVKNLKEIVTEFLDRIIESRDLIPYSILFMTNVLEKSLINEFPNLTDKIILKIIGNFLYYHFLNTAIVLPDDFDMNPPYNRSVADYQRKNLATIAKVLQFAVSNKGFNDDAPHLICLNPFIVSCHGKLKKFFKSCCQVESLENHFKIHEYTEVARIERPTISISLQDICNIHSLLLEYQHKIAPNKDDSIHQLLADMGMKPSIGLLMGMPEKLCNNIGVAETKINIILVNKFEIIDKQNENIDELLVKTKILVVTIIEYCDNCQINEVLESIFTVDSQDLNESISDIPLDSSIELRNYIFELKICLRKLEEAGIVSRDDGYKSIITSIISDYHQEEEYTSIINKEMESLTQFLRQLQKRSSYIVEQTQLYNQYIEQCLDNLNTKKGTLPKTMTLIRNDNHQQKSGTTSKTLKYCATQLVRKGIVVDIKGFNHSKWKYVNFEIYPSDKVGVFIIKAIFDDIHEEKTLIDIQDLLGFQFEGMTVITLCSIVKVDIDLLLNLVNRKFYG